MANYSSFRAMAIATILAVFGATTPVVAQGASQGAPPDTKPADADVKGEEASSHICCHLRSALEEEADLLVRCDE